LLPALTKTRPGGASSADERGEGTPLSG